MPERGLSARTTGVESHSSGDLEAWGGIVSGHVTDWADRLDVTPERFLDACDEVEILFDTATEKGSGKKRDRPTDPALRSVAMTAEAAETVAERLA